MKANHVSVFFWSLISFFCLSACTPEEDVDCVVAQRTVLVYVAADNDLLSFAFDDLKEMKEGMRNIKESDLHLLAYVDTGSSARLVNFVNVGGEVQEEIIREYGDRNSVGVTEMREVFNDVFANPAFLAESYGLVFWSHADGWIPYENPSTRWIGVDKTGNKDYRMNLADFVQVLQESPHLDFIFFDACFMLSIEVAYELRHYTDFYIASPTENPGPGAPYNVLVPLMYADNAAYRMADANFRYYQGLYNDGIGISNNNWTGGVSCGVLCSSELDNLAFLTDQLLSSFSSGDVADLRNAVFDCDRRYSSHVGYYDLEGMMKLLLDNDDFQVWKNTYSSSLCSYYTTPMNFSQYAGMFSMEESNGATNYIPDESAPTDVDAYCSLSWYKDALSKLAWERYGKVNSARP